MMKKVAVIQARMGSSRLRGKVLMPLGGGTVLGYVIERCRQSAALDDIIVATSIRPADDEIEETCNRWKIPVFRGSEDDVLLRYVQAGQWCGAGHIVRITADCPFIDPDVIDKVIGCYDSGHHDYVSMEGYPRGLGDVEIASLATLEKILSVTTENDTVYREHVTTYIVKHPDRFDVHLLEADPPFSRSELRVCVDEPADLEAVRRIGDYFHPRMDFSSLDIIRLMDAHPEIPAINKDVRQKIV